MGANDGQPVRPQALGRGQGAVCDEEVGDGGYTSRTGGPSKIWSLYPQNYGMPRETGLEGQSRGKETWGGPTPSRDRSPWSG